MLVFSAGSGKRPFPLADPVDPVLPVTVGAVIGTLLLALQYRQMGQQGCLGASTGVDQESSLLLGSLPAG